MLIVASLCLMALCTAAPAQAVVVQVQQAEQAARGKAKAAEKKAEAQAKEAGEEAKDKAAEGQQRVEEERQEAGERVEEVGEEVEAIEEELQQGAGAMAEQGRGQMKKAENMARKADRGNIEARIQRLFEQEQARHDRRMERIEAIRTIASQKGDEESLGRVGQLVEKENEIHSRRLDQIRRVQSKMQGAKIN